MSFLKIFFRKEQIITARHKKLRPGTNSYGQAHIVTACGVPLVQQAGIFLKFFAMTEWSLKIISRILSSRKK
jgi:hypothetical protein